MRPETMIGYDIQNRVVVSTTHQDTFDKFAILVLILY